MPLATSGPKVSSLTVRAGELERFTVVPSRAALPGIEDLGVTWRMNGTVAGSGAVLVVDPGGLGTGPHTLTASAADASSKVGKDPTGLMARTITCALDKAPTAAMGAKTLTTAPPNARATPVGGTVTASNTVTGHLSLVGSSIDAAGRDCAARGPLDADRRRGYPAVA